MGKPSKARARKCKDAARDAVHKHKGATYNPSFKTVDDERFEKFYNSARRTYLFCEDLLDILGGRPENN